VDVTAAMQNEETTVVIENVGLRRAGKRLFEGLSLNLTERRIGLVGHNGSGKSSLLRLIHGLIPPDQGRVSTLGMDTALDARQIPARVGFLFQNPDHQILFPTVGEEIGFGLANQGLPQMKVMEQVHAFLETHGCGNWSGWAVDELSGGQKQLVCLLAVMIMQPDLILLDEPFASLDLANRIAFAERLRNLSPQVILASHDLDLLGDCDRIIWLDNGSVRQDGSPAEILPLYRADAAEKAGAMM